MANILFEFEGSRVKDIDEEMLEKVNKFLENGIVELDNPNLQKKMEEFAEDVKLDNFGFADAKITFGPYGLDIDLINYIDEFRDEKIMAFLLSLIVKEGMCILEFVNQEENYAWGYYIKPRVIECFTYEPKINCKVEV